MQASDRILARRYALALFQSVVEHAVEHKEAGHEEEEKARRDLESAHRVWRDQARFFANPVGGAARQRAWLRDTLGRQISLRALRFLELLAQKKRFHLLPAVCAEFGRLQDERRGLARARVRSVEILTPAEEETLRGRLEAFSGMRVALEVEPAPELLGGAVVRLGDWVLDGSLQGQLRQLGRRLAEA